MIVWLTEYAGVSGREEGRVLSLPIGLRRQRRLVVVRHAGAVGRLVEGGLKLADRPMVLLRFTLPSNEHWEV